ncbi:MAG: tubulin-like doman-containing protein [Bradymonadaceae bacterium]
MANGDNVVVDELIKQPSMVSPTLFVGLGGCGCQIVARVAEHLKQRPDYEERYSDLVKFGLVDTNINDLESYREHADERFLISDFEKEEYANFASGQKFLEEDDYFTQWIPRDYRFRAGDTAGAGQIRIESRLGCYYQMKHGDFVPRFRRLLEELKSHEHGHRRLESDEIRVVICYSVAGGTGSGAFLPIAYTLRDEAAQLGKPEMLGVNVLPAVFEDVTGANKDGTFANGYAALKELEHLMKLGAPESKFYPEDGREFHYNPADKSNTHVHHQPFDFVYMVDKPESFTVDDVVDSAADGLYLQLFSPLFGVQASDYDNYTQHQRFLVPHDFEAKGIVGYTQFYASYGAAVLLVPVPGLVEYCSRAAALDVMSASFLGSIPGGEAYAQLRANREPFDQVKERDEEDAPMVHVSEFDKRDEGLRQTLRDRLFQKRIRLLAKCEFDASESGRFRPFFRHGHRLGAVPRELGAVERDPELRDRQRQQLADRGMNYSIGAVVLPAIAGREPGDQPGLLREVGEELRKKSREIKGNERKREGQAVRWWKSQANSWAERLKNHGLQTLSEGYYSQNVEYPGMESLVELDFLEEDADQVSLTAKRYAALQILEELQEQPPEPNPPGGFELTDHQDSDELYDAQAIEQVIDDLMDQAQRRAYAEIQREFNERRNDFRDALNEMREVVRTLESGFDDFERQQRKRLERLRETGHTHSNQFVLDSEAFQIENGRRMWDYFFEDRVSNQQEFRLSDPDVQQILSGTVRTLSLRDGGSSTTLEEMFERLKGYAAGVLEETIGGNPKAEEEADRKGLTLSEALELEVTYRALHQSNYEEIDSEGRSAIRDIVATYNAKPREEKIDLDEDVHQDYLRDKIERTVKEKASLLCSYDESRDEHGGVRPADNFLACIHEDFENSTIEEAVTGADVSDLEWVKEGWDDPQKIIFYRSVLNVPPYVFGRMDEMKDYYYRFKNLAKRPKVLHIDKNWEETLPDLDPASAQERHRKEKVRRNIINFGVLLTIDDPVREHEGFIIHRDGTYYLRPPQIEIEQTNGEEDENAWAALGTSLAESIEGLPSVLEAEKIKYRQFQQVLKAVRNGMAPQVLQQVVKLPIRWRETRDELRTQYGSNPTPEQEMMLADYTDAFRRMKEALEQLLEDLRNKQTEQLVAGGQAVENSAGLEPELANRNLRQSIEILDGFLESWRAMENPEESETIPDTFEGLFEPIPERELNETVERLRSGEFTRGGDRERPSSGEESSGERAEDGGGVQPSVPSPEEGDETDVGDSP